MSLNYTTNSNFFMASMDLMETLKGFHLLGAVATKGAPTWVSLYEDSVRAEDDLFELAYSHLKANTK